MPLKRMSPIWILLKIIISIASSIIAFFTITYIEGLSNNQIEKFLDIFNLPKYGAPTAGALITLALMIFALFILSPVINLIQNFFSALTGKYFVISLAALAFLGAAAALYIPSYTNWFKPDTQQSASSTQNEQGSGNQQSQSSKDPSSDLRLHLLYITGGVIAVLGLIETNRKNSQDHIRQVHAARRDRYIEAVDKLSSENASVRLGGVYALVGLVDEWLDDDNMDRESRIKEGQIIINNFCSYIRSPFPLAEKIEEYEARKELEKLQKTDSEKLSKKDSSRLQILLKRFKDSDEYEKPKDITADYAKLHEEQDVRRAIFDEIHKRSSNIVKDEKGKVVETIPGLWSDFDFNFSRAPIFYPLNNLTIEKGNFSNAKLYTDTNFTDSIFIHTANFSEATFIDIVSFQRVTFAHTADFYEASFAHTANFSNASFTHTSDFWRVTFAHTANFSDATFNHDVVFWGTTFAQYAHFWGTTFAQYAYFWRATFTGAADFSDATFTGAASFSDATFTGAADFSNVTFTQRAEFINTTFTQKVRFRNTTFENYEPLFASEEERAKFSVHPSQEDYIFSVPSGSKPIHTRETKLDDVTRRIPIGTVLFDPSSPKDENGKYRESPPA